MFRIYVNDLMKHYKMNKKLFKKQIINKDVPLTATDATPKVKAKFELHRVIKISL